MQSPNASGSSNSHTTKKTIADLEKITRDYAAGSIDSLDEFAKYWNEFDGVARGLVEAKIISKAERDLYFWIGLPYATRKAIGQQLATTDLAFHDRLIPAWRDAILAGRHVFHDPSTTSKQEKEIDKLVRTLHGLSVDDSNYAVAYARLLVAAPNVADRILPPSRWTRSPSSGPTLAIPHSHPATPFPQSNGGVVCRPALRRVQSYVSYQWCPSCADQHAVHRNRAT
ncbi:hypothetical protein D9756_006303 [Leucocoprinus leucothites]|uniref:Uncharacterized protein n=1 Tax=Leucocoprinus leucothites TaxID=201217 RepID=A0A8H5D436_9AGAR|nr:hypothetical protein D9756_006303 [Leucoagaricus leucothites]